MVNENTKNVCMIAHSYFPSDTRIRKEATALVEKGYNVDIVCLRDNHEKPFEVFKNINIYRLPINRQRNKGALQYFYEYIGITFLSFLKLTQLNLKRHYKYIHVHNPPDTLVFSALPFKLLGKKIIFDVHDPNPEIFASRFEKDMDNFFVKIWIFLEKIALKLSDSVISVSDSCRDVLMKRGGFSKNKFYLVMNAVDPAVFNREKITKNKLELKGNFVILYQGAIMKRRGLDYVLDAINDIKDKIPNVQFVVLGGGPYLDSLKKKIKEDGLKNYVQLKGQVSVEDVASYVSISDLCIISFADAPINRLGTPNKLFEYAFFEKLQLVPKFPALSKIVTNDDVFFYEPENHKDIAKKILQAYRNPDNAKAKRTKNKLQKYSWDVMKKNLYQCYEDLT